MKRLFSVFLIIGLSLPSTGCIALLAGAGGTVLWQMGKVISEEQVSMKKGVEAVESAFKAEKITLENKVIKNDVTQLRGKDENYTKVAVDVFSKGSRISWLLTNLDTISSISPLSIHDEMISLASIGIAASKLPVFSALNELNMPFPPFSKSLLQHLSNFCYSGVCCAGSVYHGCPCP